MEDSDLLASVKKTNILATECTPIDILCINQIFFCVCKYLLNAYILLPFCDMETPSYSSNQGFAWRRNLAFSSWQQPCNRQCILKMKLNVVSVVQRMFFFFC